MDRLERQALDAIDEEGLLGFLCRLIAIPSVGGKETAAQEMVAQQMERCGLTVDLWELDFDELRRHPAYSTEIERSHGLGLVGTAGHGEDGRDLIFNGHVDVVPAGEIANWSYAPWEGTLTDRRVYGRGAVDMKGGLCCALFAAKALRDAGVELRGRLLVESVIGEEDGGVGTLATLLRGHSADGAVVMEPTNLALVTAQAGALNFRLLVSGQAAHGSVRTQGVSAVEKFHLLFEALQRLERQRNRDIDHPLLARFSLPYSLNIGTVRAGEWPSSVPETLVCEGRFGIAVGEDLEDARALFEKAIDEASRADDWLARHPATVEWWGGRFESAETPADHPVARAISSAFRTLLGKSPVVEGVPYGADMRLLVNEGAIPSVMFGPGDVRNSHRPDEFVPIDDLLITTRTLALTALRFCGVVEDRYRRTAG